MLGNDDNEIDAEKLLKLNLNYDVKCMRNVEVDADYSFVTQHLKGSEGQPVCLKMVHISASFTLTEQMANNIKEEAGSLA